MRGVAKESKSLAHRMLKLPPREFFNVCSFYPSQFVLVEDSPSVRRVRELSLSVLDDQVYMKIRALREIEDHPERIIGKLVDTPKE